MDSDKLHINENFEFKAEMKQLLHLIIHSLYTHPEIFLRELVSNSSDALNKLRIIKLTDSNILNPEDELKIVISFDEKEKTFSIEDNGIGMNKEDLINNLGTVASSGTQKFIEELKKNKTSSNENLIGQFGVGFYSVFMVTDEVTVETRNYQTNSIAYKWTSKGETTFTIEEIEKEKRGTKILFRFKESAEEFANEFSLKTILNKYSNFVDFPIELNNEKINKVQAIWQKKKEDISKEEANEFYKFITNDWQDPLDYFNVNVEGVLNFKSLLFLPAEAPSNLFQDLNENGIQLYSNKVLIQNNSKDILPEYLRFIRGVLDTEDISLNVSRESAQNTPILNKIRNILTSKILNYFDEMRKNNLDIYLSMYKKFNSLFKTGITTDFTHKDQILELLYFESTLIESEKMTTLNGYVSRMKSDQEEIYYASGTSRQDIERNPNLEYFQKNNLEVLFMTDTIDMFILPYIFEYDKKKLVSIEKAEIKIEDKEQEKNTETKEENNELIAKFKEILNNKIEDVRASTRLVNSAFTLVSGTQGMDKQFEKMMKMMDKDYNMSQRILELNFEHPLIKNLIELNKNKDNEKLQQLILHIYETSLLNDGLLNNINDYSERMINIMLDASKQQNKGQ